MFLKNNFQNPPAGMQLAKLIRIIDFGTQPQNFEGKLTGYAQEMKFVWEMLGDEKMADGKPFTHFEIYKNSLAPKAKITPHLTSWLGKAPSDTFDLRTLLGKACILNGVLVPKKQGGGDKYKLMAVLPIMDKFQENIKPINEIFSYEIDSSDTGLLEKLSDWDKKKIMESPEFKNKFAPAGGIVAPAKSAGGSGDMDDDEVPF